MFAASVLCILLVAQPPASCKDVEVCRAEALIAHAREDYEGFHDLAWTAYRKGRSNDPELMLLVARAQSLSGRPGDALVMLERIAALGAPTDALTSDDFARVRALPRWPEVATKLAGSGAAPSSDIEAATASKPAAVRATRPEKTPPPAETKPTPEPTRGVGSPSEPSKLPPPADPLTPERSPKSAVAAAAPALPAAPKREPGAPLKFSTPLAPSALAYDGVSKRFIIADRRARRIAVVDETTGQVATLVGALGALGDIEGIAIDGQQGDLWVVSSSENGAVLHRAQLISGRVLATTPVEGLDASVVALTFARGGGLVAADASGHLWRIRPSGRAEKLASLEYVPRALASDGAGRLYVSAGGPRLARFQLSPSLRKTDLIELDSGFPAEGPFAVATGRLYTIVAGDDGYEIHSKAVGASTDR